MFNLSIFIILSIFALKINACSVSCGAYCCTDNTMLFIFLGAAVGTLVVLVIFCICRHQREMSEETNNVKWDQGQQTISFSNIGARPNETRLPDPSPTTEIVLTPLKLV